MTGQTLRSFGSPMLLMQACMRAYFSGTRARRRASARLLDCTKLCSALQRRCTVCATAMRQWPIAPSQMCTSCSTSTVSRQGQPLIEYPDREKKRSPFWHLCNIGRITEQCMRSHGAITDVHLLLNKHGELSIPVLEALQQTGLLRHWQQTFEVCNPEAPCTEACNKHWELACWAAQFMAACVPSEMHPSVHQGEYASGFATRRGHGKGSQG